MEHKHEIIETPGGIKRCKICEEILDDDVEEVCRLTSRVMTNRTLQEITIHNTYVPFTVYNDFPIYTRETPAGVEVLTAEKVSNTNNYRIVKKVLDKEAVLEK